jgi:hypothetical protein
MVLSIIFLEDKHKIVLHLSILHEYQQCGETPTGNFSDVFLSYYKKKLGKRGITGIVFLMYY